MSAEPDYSLFFFLVFFLRWRAKFRWTHLITLHCLPLCYRLCVERGRDVGRALQSNNQFHSIHQVFIKISFYLFHLFFFAGKSLSCLNVATPRMVLDCVCGGAGVSKILSKMLLSCGIRPLSERRKCPLRHYGIRKRTQCAFDRFVDRTTSIKTLSDLS